MRAKPVNVSEPAMAEMPKIGSPEVTRRLPGMRVVGKERGGRGAKVIGALYDSEKLYQDVTKPHYRERASRTIKVEESPLVTRIKHMMPDTDKQSGQQLVVAKMPETVGKKSVGVQSDNTGSRGVNAVNVTSEGAKPMSQRQMAQEAHDETVQESMIEESDLLKPVVNELGVIKTEALPQAPAKVDNEPQYRRWKDLTLGEHIPTADIHPYLSLVPKPTMEKIVKMTDTETVVKEKKPRKPRQPKKVVEEVMEESESDREVVTEKKKRGASAYNQFVAEHRKKGMSMKEIGEMYRKSKQ